MTLGKFFRSLTDHALAPKTFLGSGNNTLGWVKETPFLYCDPRVAKADRADVDDFFDGFYHGFRYFAPESGRGAAYENGLVLGERLRALRAEHGLLYRFAA